MKKTLLALGLAGIAATASADSFFYAGGNFGQSDFGSGADKKTAYGFQVGTGILPLLGIEGGYWSHGNDTSSLFVAAKPSIDFGPLHVYAKGGLHSWDRDKGSDGTGLMYGVGAEYFLVDNLSLGGSWQSFNRGDNLNDITSFTVSATFHFL
ncbi:porin family protein [Vibrio sp. S9_S30]|uniref:outer membrane beta-barrel protein n=1 Tax=Vibrio sp. S9_S30 TaxID=2720226 RepID=UPI001681ADA7|nr:outer membrane beta-barrel protein [Vibrio sp. S9_S30]MBD1558825.1 porin family protein [Vibrio sp. S9_S30]